MRVRNCFSPFLYILSPLVSTTLRTLVNVHSIFLRGVTRGSAKKEKRQGNKTRKQNMNGKSCFLLIYILVSKVLTLNLPVPVFQERGGGAAWEVHQYKVASFRSWVKHPLPRGPSGHLVWNCLHTKPYNLTHRLQCLQSPEYCHTPSPLTSFCSLYSLLGGTGNISLPLITCPRSVRHRMAGRV